MPAIEVVPVVTGKQQKQFLELPWPINRDDPNWMPPLRLNQKLLCGFGKHPFYNDAQSQAFLAMKDGQPAGRVLAIVNHAHNRFHQEQRGFFGFFQSVDDEAVSGALFDAAAQWLRGKGMTAVRGPADPSINYEWGLLIDGFETPPYFMMTHNPRYYERLVEAWGFTKAQDLFAYGGDLSIMHGLKKQKKLIRMDETIRERFGITVRAMDTSRFRQEIETFLDIYNQALAGTWGYVPLSRAEVVHLGKDLRRLIVPELAIVAEIDGEPIGVTFGLLDYNPRIKKIDGRLFPFGFARLLWNKRAIKRIRVVSTNVLPKYQGWGVGIVLSFGMAYPGLEYGLEECEFSWVLETNDLSRKTLEKGGAPKYKTYRVYDREL
jgi:GNAT superfamily N-acetyltransferase